MKFKDRFVLYLAIRFKLYDLRDDTFRFAHGYKTSKAKEFVILKNAYEILMYKVVAWFSGINPMNRMAICKIVDSLGYGNWQHLEESEEELNRSYEELLEEFLDEIDVPDRYWSWNRILRVNWMFFRLEDRAKYYE